MSNTNGRRADVLAVLRRADAPMSIAAIADQLYIHLNTVRFHLDALLAGGQVERAEAAQAKPGRPAQFFRVVHGMDPGGPRHYELLATALVDSLARQADLAAEADAAGRALGARLGRPRRSAARRAPVRQLLGLLDDLGFAPERQAGDTRIGLRHCPFLELAQARPEVVCPVHLGLMRGAMTAWDSPIAVEKLTPFVEPDLCVAQLAGAVS